MRGFKVAQGPEYRGRALTRGSDQRRRVAKEY